MKVPNVLLSGNHKDIGIWREEQLRMRTAARREDLIEKKKEN
jgi:tRNA (guanine-N1)-methyltransferase